MQLAGQTSLHCGSSSAPTHSVQRKGSMVNITSPAAIASFGQTGRHASHAVQSSLIKRAISISPLALGGVRLFGDTRQLFVSEGAPQRRTNGAGEDRIWM